MFDPLLDGTRAGAKARSGWAFPASLAGHGLLIGLIVESVTDPQLPVIFAALAPSPPPPPPPAAGSAAGAAAAGPRLEEFRPEREEILQPSEILEDLPFVELAGSEDGGVGAGEQGGEAWGVDGGARGGPQGGVPGGSPGGLGSSDEAPLVLTPEMTEPVLRRRLEPEYPEVARVARLEGSVILRAVISARGQVEEITVLRSSNPLFDEAAVAAVRQWEYEPARQGGRPVAVYLTIHVIFSLR